MLPLQAQLHALQGVPVIVVGDVMLDHYVFGAVTRISPEAPVPVLRGQREIEMLGGAGNVARNLAATGSAPVLIGTIGADRHAERLRELMSALGADAAFLVTDAARPTTVKVRFLAGSHPILRMDWEDTAPLSDALQEALVARGASGLEAARSLVISDYGKGVITPATAQALISAARARGVPVVVDPKGRDWSLYAGATVITPNRSELRLAAGLADDADAETMIAAAREMIARLGLGAILLTRSEEGMTIIVPGAEPHTIPAQTREVADVSGAGDTVVALIAAGLGAGLDLADAAAIANIAAGVVVGKIGAATASPEEILRAAHAAQEGADLDDKVMALPALLERVADWRDQGLAVGFTNGCFDLLHPGHVRLLAEARRRCDRLVVALNTDASVSRLKGPERPVQDLAARATVMAALASVDAVVAFDEDTPLELIRAVLPDVLLKGADYTAATIVGADVVLAAGGRVETVALVPGRSTTGIIAKLRG
jgi:D-beta-D-heptose 7-phosphate kinase/D-beta-D-heptose 1-phosphate adenosyltransferase